MKKVIIIITFALSLFLLSCEPYDNRNKEYTFYVTYFNGDKDTLKIKGEGENRFLLKEGDIMYAYNGKVVASSVRHFDVVIKIIE